MLPRFHLDRPRNIEDALEAYAASDDDAAYLAGGTELLQVMKMGLAEFGTLIDLKAIKELGGIAVEGDGTLRIGSTVTHREIERSALVGQVLPALIELERGVANLRIRSAGTLGGNLAFAEPHSDPGTLLLACDARVELAGPNGRREVPLSEFTLGPLLTVREPDEILVAIRIPQPVNGEASAYAKVKFFERPAVSVGVRLRVADGVVTAALVAIGSMTERPQLVEETASALVGAEASEDGLASVIEAASAPLAELDAVEDLNGSADYKRHLATVLLRKVTSSALSEAANHA